MHCSSVLGVCSLTTAGLRRGPVPPPAQLLDGIPAAHTLSSGFREGPGFAVAQVKVLELEKMLENERIRLGELRKKHYALAGVYDDTDSGGAKLASAPRRSILKKPPLAQKPARLLKQDGEVLVLPPPLQSTGLSHWTAGVPSPAVCSRGLRHSYLTW